MIVTLKFEHIGQNYDRGRHHHMKRYRRGLMRVDEMKKFFGARGSRRPWVADCSWSGRIERTFLDGHTSYREADRKGERGIYLYFHVRPGRIYEVCHWTSWSNKERFFCRITDRSVVHINKNEAIQCLKNGLT